MGTHYLPFEVCNTTFNSIKNPLKSVCIFVFNLSYLHNIDIHGIQLCRQISLQPPVLYLEHINKRPLYGLVFI